MKDEWTYKGWTGKRSNVRNHKQWCWKGKKRHRVSPDAVWKQGERKKAETDKWVERDEECLREFLSSFCSRRCRAKPTLLADVSSSTLSAPPASPPFILPLSSCHPPPLSCMAHSCSSTPRALGLIHHECVLKEPSNLQLARLKAH